MNMQDSAKASIDQMEKASGSLSNPSDSILENADITIITQDKVIMELTDISEKLENIIDTLDSSTHWWEQWPSALIGVGLTLCIQLIIWAYFRLTVEIKIRKIFKIFQGELFQLHELQHDGTYKVHPSFVNISLNRNHKVLNIVGESTIKNNNQIFAAVELNAPAYLFGTGKYVHKKLKEGKPLMGTISITAIDGKLYSINEYFATKEGKFKAYRYEWRSQNGKFWRDVEGEWKNPSEN